MEVGDLEGMDVYAETTKTIGCAVQDAVILTVNGRVARAPLVSKTRRWFARAGNLSGAHDAISERNQIPGTLKKHVPPEARGTRQGERPACLNVVCSHA
ncbi:MAG: hypothetical protein LBC18_15570 [Opitutaceae bacterium]|nr:hypothetical protein [Opitutaceae bacterium]